jgi:hypothetical protein
MKVLLLMFTALFLTVEIQAQTVENIRVEPEGDQILIHFRIGESKDRQVYNVSLTCSIDGGQRFEPRTVMGDVGQRILGGKSNYTITWDVFEDLEEIGEVEFFIKIDLAEDYSKPVEEEESYTFAGGEKQDQDKQFTSFLGYNGSTYSPYGLSGGSLNQYGFFLSARTGTNNDEFQTDFWVNLIAGITFQAFTRGIYRLHAYAGPGISIEHYKDLVHDTNWTSPALVLEGGIHHVVGRIGLCTGVAFVSGYGVHFVFGVGFLF